MSFGIALGFSNELVSGISYNMPHPSKNITDAIGWNFVYYDRDAITHQFVPLFIDVLKNDLTARGWLTVCSTLKRYSAFIKNPTFQDEREVRIIYYPYKDHTENSISGVSNLKTGKIPHCTLPWLKSDGTCALKEIIIGTNCQRTKEDIRSLLDQNGVDSNISIVKSEYPYRISGNR